MKLTFKSVAIQNNNPVNIEFTTELTREFEGDFDVLTFTEPSRNVANRIEISKERVNIFAGATTLILRLNTWFDNPFMISKEGSVQEVKFYTYLHSLDFNESDQKYTLVYDLSSRSDLDGLIGSFTITLEIK